MRERNLEIEVLRCIAIVFTLLQHIHTLVPDPRGWMAFPGRYLGFWTGVDLFFVVSGFVIMTSLSALPGRRARGEPIRSELFAFWVRRAFRLLPTAWLWLVLPMLFSIIFVEAHLYPPFQELWRGALSAFLNVHNFTGAWCRMGNAEAPLCHSLLLSGHYWSLSLEEQFYLVLPLMLVILPRLAFVPLALAGIGICVFTPRPLFSLASFLRVDGLLWGVLLALLRDAAVLGKVEPVWLARWPLRVVVSSALIFALARVPVVWGGLGIDLVGPHRSYTMAAVALVGALLVWLASYDRGYLFGKSAALRPFVYLGSRSYSIYVIHLPVFNLLHSAVLKFPWSGSMLPVNLGVAFTAVALTLLLSELNYRFVEMPLRERGRAISARMRSRAQGQARAVPDAAPEVPSGS